MAAAALLLLPLLLPEKHWQNARTQLSFIFRFPFDLPLMGNTLITSVCRREEPLEFEDISDETFDFIAVAMHQPEPLRSSSKIQTKSKTQRSAFSSSVVHPTLPVGNVVTVVPVSFSTESSSTTPMPKITDVAIETMSFNDRLNMLKWDPEDMPTYAKRQELFVFDEYAPRPATTKNLKTKPRGWLRRAVDTYKQAKFTRRQQKTTQKQKQATSTDGSCSSAQPTRRKRSRFATMWGPRPTPAALKDEPFQLDISAGDALFADEEEKQFLVASPRPCVLDKLSTDCDEVLSETESESIESSLASDSDCMEESDDESEWTRSTSSSSLYFSADEDESPGGADNKTSDDTSFFVSKDAFCMQLDDYLRDDDDADNCVQYTQIERDVTASSSWMNEAERRSLCRMLKAYVSYNPAATFRKEMIADAEECLVVFSGDELAAFNAFVLMSQTKW
ncbi:hypothetical protein PINS_up002170 [Pythium insidiosum]|nr:hypothetical protein PINS_up002170 [Pythium insidiosum]